MLKAKGYFNEEGNAYTLLTPKTKAEYRTCLMNSLGYGFQVNQYGSGLTQCKSNFRNKNNVGSDRTVYFRDDETNDVWCVGGYPFVSKVENYKCTHYQSYTEIESEHNGIKVKIRFFVPYDRRGDIQTVEVVNLSGKNRKISIIPVVNYSLNGYKAPAFCDFHHKSYRTDFVDEINGLYIDGKNPYADGRAGGDETYTYNAQFCSTTKVDYYSADERNVFGFPNSLSHPHALLAGENLDSKPMCSQQLTTMLQTVIELKPKESFKTDYVLVLTNNFSEAKAAVKGVENRDGVEKLFAETLEYDLKRRNKVTIKTPDEETNRFINYWLKMGCEWNILFRRNPRDNLQFSNATLCYTPEALKFTLENLMALQYKDGHAVRCWLPLDATHFADESMWYVYALCDYLKFTEDYEFLDKVIPYLDEGEGTVWEHIIRAVSVVDEGRGPNGVTLSHFGDWNDAMSTGLHDENAESVFVSMQLALALKEMAGLCKQLGKADEEKVYTQKYEALKKLLNEVCWDKEGYYVRSFAGGKVYGSSECEKGSKIFVNPQSWAFMAGVCPEDRIPSVYSAIEKYLETDVGCVVNYPPYTEYDPIIGRISFQYPGTVENGAIYAHATAFKVYADCVLGNGDLAFRDYKKLLPENPKNPPEVADTVPYSISNYCTTADILYGKSSAEPFSTGTMSWLFRIAVEGFMGVRYEYGGFKIAPAFPEKWDKAELQIERNDTVYEFKITNNNTGKQEIYVDGRLLEGNFVKFSKAKKVLVEVKM